MNQRTDVVRTSRSASNTAATDVVRAMRSSQLNRSQLEAQRGSVMQTAPQPRRMIQNQTNVSTD